MLHSRSPSATTRPKESARIWISMCRGRSRYFSTYTSPAPNALSASLVAASNADASSLSSRTRRMPLPPPPAAALTSTGNPSRAHMRRQTIDLGIDRHRLEALLVAGADDPQGDLPAVGDENPFDGGHASSVIRRPSSVVRRVVTDDG